MVAKRAVAAIRLGAVALAALVGTAFAARADDAAPKQLVQSSGWTSYTVQEGGRLVCYALAEPDKPDPKRKHKAHLMVTHRPAEKIFNVVSIDMGQDLAADGSADVTIGKDKYDFFTRQSSAWSRDADTDKNATISMTKAKILTVKLKSGLTDSYSLMGFTDALAAIDKACKARR
jgi:hypothetical protein